MVRLSVPKTWLATAVLAAGLFVGAPGMVRGEPNCTCRYAGQSHALDTCVCIVTPNGARMVCRGRDGGIRPPHTVMWSVPVF